MVVLKQWSQNAKQAFSMRSEILSHHLPTRTHQAAAAFHSRNDCAGRSTAKTSALGYSTACSSPAPKTRSYLQKPGHHYWSRRGVLPIQRCVRMAGGPAFGKAKCVNNAHTRLKFIPWFYRLLKHKFTSLVHIREVCLLSSVKKC